MARGIGPLPLASLRPQSPYSPSKGGWYFLWSAVVLYILVELVLLVVACWSGSRGLASIVSKLETTVYLALLFPFKTKLLPWVYQISSGLVRGSPNNPSRGFVQWFKVSRQEWKGREPSGVGRRVTGLRTSQADILRPGFSISTTWYLKILWSDIRKWPLPFRSCFTWWLVKIVSLPPKESFKVSSISIAKQLQDFEGRETSLGQLGRASWINKLQAGAQIPSFELRLLRLFLLFNKVGILFLALETSRQVPELRLVLV